MTNPIFGLFLFVVPGLFAEQPVNVALPVIQSVTDAGAYKSLASDLLKGENVADKKIVVADFSYADARDSKDSGVVAERLTTELVKTGKLKVIERKELEKIFKELNLQRSGAIDAGSVKSVGKILGADWVVIGTLTNLPENRLELNARLVGVESGEIASAGRVVLVRDWLNKYRDILREQDAEMAKTAKPNSISIGKSSAPADNDSQLFYDRGVMYTDLGEMDNAIGSFGIAADLDPGNAKVFVGRGYVRYLNGDMDKAIEDYSKAISISPKDADFYFKRGMAYSRKKNFENAIADYSKAIAISPNSTLLYFNRGKIYSAQKQFDKAEKDYSATISLDPEFAEAYYERAVVFGNQQLYNRAAADVAKLKSMNSKYSGPEYTSKVALMTHNCTTYECVSRVSEKDFEFIVSSLSNTEKEEMGVAAKKKVRACFPERDGDNIVVPPEFNIWDGERRLLQYLCRNGFIKS